MMMWMGLGLAMVAISLAKFCWLYPACTKHYNGKVDEMMRTDGLLTSFYFVLVGLVIALIWPVVAIAELIHIAAYHAGFAQRDHELLKELREEK